MYYRNSECFRPALQDLKVDPSIRGADPILLMRVNEQEVDGYIKANSRVTPGLAAAPAAEAAAAAESEPKVTSPVDAEIRALLDARDADLLACMASSRVLLEATANVQ